MLQLERLYGSEKGKPVQLDHDVAMMLTVVKLAKYANIQPSELYNWSLDTVRMAADVLDYYVAEEKRAMEDSSSRSAPKGNTRNVHTQPTRKRY